MGPGLRSEVWATGRVPKCYLKVGISALPCLAGGGGASRPPETEHKSAQRVGLENLHPQNPVVEPARDQRKAPSLPASFTLQLGGEA